MSPWLGVAVCIAYPLVGLAVLWIIAGRARDELADDAPASIAFGFAVFWPPIVPYVLVRLLVDRFGSTNDRA